MESIMMVNSPKLSNLLEEHLGYKPVIYTFEEKFGEYKSTCKRTKTKDLGTPEYFSLQFDSLLSDLKKSVWVTCTEEDIPILTKHFKILEICK